MTLVKQAAARLIAVSSGSESVEWISGADCWTSAGWLVTIIVTVGILVYLVSTWWNTGNVAATASNSTQTLEEGCNSQDIPARILLVRNGRAALCKNSVIYCRSVEIFWSIWNVLNKFRARHQIHYASGEDELGRCGFIKKSKARVAKHDDQVKHEDEKE